MHSAEFVILTVFLIDFTKQYNRLKQHNAVTSGTASTMDNKMAVLPVINRPRPQSKVNPGSTAETKEAMDKRISDQLTALSKYSSRIVNIDVPYSKPSQEHGYSLGVSVNRKGPSATANQKDKSDRATNEQVLDPRTRIILFKMIGRGLVKEINGCVSTGKEVSLATSARGRISYLLWRQTSTMR